MMNDSLYSSDQIEWQTPQFIFDKLNAEFDFTLDSCASAENAKCARYFTIEDDALRQNWTGRVWMNPPYGRKIAAFVIKAYQEVVAGNVDLVVCLIPVRSDTKWWHGYVMRATEIRLLTRRLEFIGSNNKAPFPASVVVFKKSDLPDQNNYPRLSAYCI